MSYGRKNGKNGKPAAKPRPVFSIGPVVTGRGQSVSACVWQTTLKGDDDRKVQIHRIQLQSSYFDEKEEAWKQGTSFQANQIGALEFVLGKCKEFVFEALNRQKDAERQPGDEPAEREEIPY